MRPTTHTLRCPGCNDYRGFMVLERPRLPWWDDYFCKPCGENPAINVMPPMEEVIRILAIRLYWAEVLERGDRRMIYNASDYKAVAV